MELDPLTTWTLIIAVGGPWVVGVMTLAIALMRYLERLDREEPLYDPVLENLRRGMER